MSTTTALLDRIKSQTGLNSDYAIAKALGISRQAVSHYRTGKNQLDSNGVFIAAELLGMNHAEILSVLASIEAERARDDDTRATWQARLKKLGGVAATVSVFAALCGMPAPADASQYPVRIIAPAYSVPYCFQK